LDDPNLAGSLDIIPETAAPSHPTISPGPPDRRTLALGVLAILAVFYTLYFAASIILPIVLALLLNLLLLPGKRLLAERLRLPAALAALLLILALFVVVAGVAAALALPASSWVSKAPQAFGVLQKKLAFVGPAIEFARHGLEHIRDALQAGQGGAGNAAGNGTAPAVLPPPSNVGGVGMALLEGTRAVLGQLLTLIVLLFFLLAYGDSLLRRVVEVMPSFGEKKQLVQIVLQIEQNISAYLLTITVMNLLVGIANGLSMWLQGMPDPLLWGTLAFLLNYIPILGPFTGVVIFLLVGLFVASSVWGALLPPAIYLIVHVIEGETVTPMLLARRLTLNPVLVIVALFFWDWMWGVPGAFLAVPLLAVTKIVCDRIPTLGPLGHVLGAPKHGGLQA
jgi:predicted PurR-regulated permease PerM